MAGLLIQSSNSTIVPSPGLDLSLSETLLGVLKSKDRTNTGVIHSSDFQRAITDLGFPVGDPIVQDMLVHCKIDHLGNIDFAPLEHELQTRRRIQSTKPKSLAQPLPTSRAAAAATGENIWRVEQDFAKRISLEQQAKRVQEYRQELMHIFRGFSHGQLSGPEVIDQLQTLGIMCTRALQMLLRELGSNDVNFVQFCAVLTKYDPAEASLADLSVYAGVQTEDHVSSDKSTFQRSNLRADHASRLRMQARSDNEVKSPTGKHVLLNDTRTHGDAAVFKNSIGVKGQIQQTMNQGHTLSMLTHNQEQMASGLAGAIPEISYSSEIRLQREQVLAALRKLDSDEMSLDQFHAKSKAIGFVIPPNLLKILQENKRVGRLPWQTCIRILDTTVFKAKALELAPSQQQLDCIKGYMLDLLSSKDGTSALVNLETAFRTMDTDHNESLSLNEFRAGIERVGLQLDEHDLRCVFHTLDKNGDGSLSVTEFVGLLRPAMSNSRQCYVRNAFTKLDRFCAGAVAVDDLIEAFNPDAHVDVVSGIKSAREIVTEMLNSFAVLENEGMVSYERFSNYFTSLSACIDSDEAYIAMMKACWGISDKAPAPALGRQKLGASLNDSTAGPTPTAKQHYGDIIAWNQEESWLEKKFRPKSRDLSVLQTVQSQDTNTIRWTTGSSSSGSGASAGDHATFEGFRANSSKRQMLVDTFSSADAKSNLTWAVDRQARVQQSAGVGDDSGGLGRDDVVEEANKAAGHTTRDRQRLRDAGGVLHQSNYSANARRNFGGPTPFAVSYEVRT